MHLTVLLDSSGRWSWQFRNDEGVVLVVGQTRFETYAGAAADAEAVCQQIAEAPIELLAASAQERTLDRDAMAKLACRIQGALETFCSVLDGQGVDMALGLLNRTVTHRYTALYRLHEQVLHNVVLVDKLNEIIPSTLAAVPYNQSFCQFAIRDGHFTTSNSAWDSRLNGHPAQGAMNAYHAFPLVNELGEVLGTVCHFDTAALELGTEDFEILGRVASVLSDHLPAHDRWSTPGRPPAVAERTPTTSESGKS